METTKMSSKGQVVIPQDVRNKLNIHEGSIFIVAHTNDAIILKKIKTPSQEELIRDLKEMAKEGQKRAEKLGIKEKDVPRIVHKSRGIHE